MRGDTANDAWHDGGLVVTGISGLYDPELIMDQYSPPPFGGRTQKAMRIPGRNLLVVADEAVLDNCTDGIKHIWLFDNREPLNPVNISTVPIPNEDDVVPWGRISACMASTSTCPTDL